MIYRWRVVARPTRAVQRGWRWAAKPCRRGEPATVGRVRLPAPSLGVVPVAASKHDDPPEMSDV